MTNEIRIPKMRRLLQPIFAVAVGLAAGLAVTWIAGENPWNLLKIICRGAFGSGYDIGMTLFYSTPLIFTGLSVAIAFHAGLFNIGAEGQLTLGALAAAAGAGAAWGAIPGWLKARRGSHEVINTIMLNFIAAGLASYVTLYLLKNPESQNPETQTIGGSYLIHQFGIFNSAPVSLALPLAIVCAGLMWIFLWRTTLGFELRAVGQSEPAARAAGIDTGKIKIIALSLAGAMAGLVGVAEVLGNAARFKVGFSPEYGFMGIAVALLGRNQPLGVVASALLFGALHKGAGDLDLETEHITREVGMMLQALIILSVSAEGLWAWMRRKGRPAV